MGTSLVVEVAEIVQLVLQVGQGVDGGLLGEPLLEGLVEALDLALGLGMVGVPAKVASRFSKPLRAPSRRVV